MLFVRYFFASQKCILNKNNPINSARTTSFRDEKRIKRDYKKLMKENQKTNYGENLVYSFKCITTNH